MDVTIDKRTLSFVNDKNMPSKEILNLFSVFSKNVNLQDYNGRVFVKLDTDADAARALDTLGILLNLKYAKKRIGCNKRTSDDNSQWEGLLLPEGSSSLKAEPICGPESDESNLLYGAITSKHGSSLHMEDIGKIDESNLQNVDAVIPSLIDLKNMKKMRPVIIANLPNQFTLIDILNLVEESAPVAMTSLARTKRKNVRFCHIYFKTVEDIAYVKQKLDKFVIGGKKLIVVEPSECLDTTKWFF